MHHEPDIDKIHLYAKDPSGATYQLLINKKECTGLKYLIFFKNFIEDSNDIDYIYKNIKKYNPNKKRKILVPFDNMIADLLSNKKINAIVTGLFLKGRKFNISLVFITQSYLMLPKLLE